VPRGTWGRVVNGEASPAWVLGVCVVGGRSREAVHAAGPIKGSRGMKLEAGCEGLMAMAMTMERGWGWASLTRASE
jgi:hypothetical protein